MFLLSNIATLYDGSSREKTAVHHNVDVLVEKGRIREVVPHQPRRESGTLLKVIDCSTYTVTPGLFDCHAHITVLGLEEHEMDLMNTQASILYVEKILYKSLVEGGVTTMRDIGGATHFMKRMVDEGVMIGPRLKIAICMLSTTGGHADFRGPDRCHASLQKILVEGPGRPSSVVDGPWECRKRVREIAACGADVIKICASPGVASPGDRLEHRDFSPEEIQAICDEAAHRGLRVAAHAHSQNGIGMAIEHGVHDLQHISYMDQKLVERAFDRNCTVTPTSWIIHELTKEQNLSDFVKEKVKKVTEVHQKAVEYAYRGGLKILAGTDPVLPRMHGRNYMEIQYLIKDGLSPLAAWHGATGLAAEEIGQSDAGTIEVGKRADFLVCKGDVLDRPEELGKGALIEVIKDGVGHRNGLSGVPQQDFARSIRQLFEEGRWPR